jgi:hypothetical protein
MSIHLIIYSYQSSNLPKKKKERHESMSQLHCLIPEKRIEEDTYSLILKYSVKKLKQNIIVITDHRDD